MALYKLSPILSVKIKYSQLRNGIYYYYRKIPTVHTGGAERFARKCHRTHDPIIAARLIAQINKAMELQWLGTDSHTIPSPHNEYDLGSFLEKAVETAKLQPVNGNDAGQHRTQRQLLRANLAPLPRSFSVMPLR